MCEKDRKDYRELFSDYVALEEENKKLRKKYENLCRAIENTFLDLYNEGVDISDLNICGRITEYEEELNDELRGSE